MRENMGLLLREAWRSLGDKISIIDDEKEWSGADLLKRAAEISDGLKKKAPKPDEPVLLSVSNRAVDFAAMLAIWELGGVSVPIHVDAPPAAFAQIRDMTGARLLVDGTGDDDWFERTESGADRSQSPYVGVLDRPPPPADPTLIDGGIVVFTSGSTGKPKGAVLSHHSLVTRLTFNERVFSFRPGDRTLLVLQITFSFGTWLSLLTITRRALLVIHRKFRPETALEDIVRRDISRVALIPTMLRAILSRSKEPEIIRLLENVRNHRTLRQIFTGGELYPDELHRRCLAVFPPLITNGYGLTETGTCDLALDKAGRSDVSAHGEQGESPGVSIRIVDEKGEPVPKGEIGELHIRSETRMNGYLGQPELTAASYADGYFRTGDLAKIAQDGWLQIVGRVNERISRGGNKIYPQEVERALLSHPAVSEALATGVADPLMGERIHVAVIADSPVSIEQLNAWAAAQIDKFKTPDVIHLVTTLPVGATGKANRGELRRQLQGDRKAAGHP
ncbi:AMP-dependent synthetase [Alphaproteobacteria bacterium]|nr:AMP-dependent synthetase [Alphaproteobacteria bacterium]